MASIEENTIYSGLWTTKKTARGAENAVLQRLPIMDGSLALKNSDADISGETIPARRIATGCLILGVCARLSSLLISGSGAVHSEDR